MCPVCASNALVCTFNSAIASDGGENPTPRAFDMFGAPSIVNSLPPCTPFETTPARLPLSAGRAKWRSDESMIPGASRVSMYAVPSPSGSSAICALSTVVPLMPVLVFRSGVSARTTIVSSTPPVCIVTSTVRTSATRTCWPSRTTLLKPWISAATE